MPTCYLTISEEIKVLTEENLNEIRKIIAKGLDSKSRVLDETHIVLRIQKAKRDYMLGEIELDIFAQFYFRRYFNRDYRANFISNEISKKLNYDCATWINLNWVGYSRVTKNGKAFYSD